MFKKGEFVVYGQSGICEITDIMQLNMTGVDRKKLYYALAPQKDKSSIIYSPIDNSKIIIREVITKKEAVELISEIPDIEELWITNEKLREESYKEAMASCDCRQWIKIIKTLYVRKQERLAAGKKVTATDERYYKQAKDYLYAELSFALGKKPDDMEKIICEYIDGISEKQGGLQPVN